MGYDNALFRHITLGVYVLSRGGDCCYAVRVSYDLSVAKIIVTAIIVTFIVTSYFI